MILMRVLGTLRAPSCDGASIVRCHWHHAGAVINSARRYTTRYTKQLAAESFVCNFMRLRVCVSSSKIESRPGYYSEPTVSDPLLAS